MGTVLAVPANPTQIATGSTWTTAAAILNGGSWSWTVTPTAASSTFTGGNFHALLGQAHGGLWFNDANLELYTTPADTLALSRALTWSAGQALTFKFNMVAATLTISGATTGNGTFAISPAGPYVSSSVLLDIGRETSGGPTFDFAGTFSNITDSNTTIALAGIALTEAVGTLGFRVAHRFALASLAFAEAVQDLAFGTHANIILASATLAETVGALTFRRAMRFTLGSVALAETVGDLSMNVGTALSIGAHGIDFQPFPYSDRDALATIDTQATGSIVIIAGGGKSSDLGLGWTENKSNTIRKLSAVLDYPDFGGYGTQIGVTNNPMAGGSGHAFTVQVANEDESTIFVDEAIGARRVSFIHASFNDTSPGTTVSIGPLVVDGPAVLFAYWFGASPVNPPFTGTSGPHGTGVGTPYTAVPNNGFTVLDANLNNFENGEVQAAAAAKVVSVGGSYSVTWTHSPAQGAELWLVAAQAAIKIALDPLALTASVGTLGFRRALKFQLGNVALAESVGTLAFRVGHVIVEGSVPLAVSVGSLGFVRHLAMPLASAALAVSVGTLGFRVAHRITLGSVALAEGVGDLTFRRAMRAVLSGIALAEAVGDLSVVAGRHFTLDTLALAEGVGALTMRRAMRFPLGAAAGLAEGVGALLFTITTGRTIALNSAPLGLALGDLAIRFTHRRLVLGPAALALGIGPLELGAAAPIFVRTHGQLAIIGQRFGALQIIGGSNVIEIIGPMLVYAGDSLTMRITVTDDADARVDLSAATALDVQVEKKLGSTAPPSISKAIGSGVTLLDQTAADTKGQADVRFDPADTAKPAGLYWLNVVLGLAGDRQHVVAPREFTIAPT